ncbi:undecaprenyl-diphosphate phosphatase [Larsenimonas rhizosphaerae]|uniref:Undecaprenyl-diphosphatase n=1 Tax=Larsenimonas rhizosphaerae TaxID=2944682 RepID=A0AA41ZGX7_9GAMM|nr:undecaprenyl-diphosphate phosphatase [Larsenimonas rhizosphaerae]MCM2129801.1 undecaprenyl-diphosphate phosphatase [Larsenimonas rhizosphaerae]MCX2524461.1 undecaprenyl-diphosphate phosphatase [Larsenimonas rhizosphaerae]
MTLDTLHLVKALILGIVEGVTEFLPVSSTGHLILAGQLLNFDAGSNKVFDVVIQLGSILAILWVYHQRLITTCRGAIQRDPVSLRFIRNVIIGFVPSAVIGFLFIDQIQAVLFRPTVVATMLVIGGVVIILTERFATRRTTEDAADMHWRQALAVGVAQCFAVIPGTSRSGSTIVGGILSKMSRKAATEYSFFLAIPTMLGATTLDLIKYHSGLTTNDMAAIVVGLISAFISALVVVRLLVRFVESRSLSVFGWYRILFGGALLLAPMLHLSW